mgnify:CR=1 FL=1
MIFVISLLLMSRGDESVANESKLPYLLVVFETLADAPDESTWSGSDQSA